MSSIPYLQFVFRCFNVATSLTSCNIIFRNVEIPSTYLWLSCTAHSILKFQVCISTGFLGLQSSSLFGYRKVFEQYATILQQKYPYLAIEGDNYPPPFLRQKMAHLLGILKILLILLVVSGTNIFQHLGVQTPSVWEWTQQNKFYACLMTFFLCNAIEGQLISTGAFEILLNDVPLWSKLETGRIPQPPELFQMIDNHLNMANPSLSMDS
uniref:EOG090X0DP2 n=1 Tax=Megafenestra aurita TaxID=2291010 RepID=A0A4Y7NJA5_9CRUS|nr:EOG090X0DP2 [Megafenestra aurita]SVE92656.1 EOG090X0DP2 [Megafenestra aurita]